MARPRKYITRVPYCQADRKRGGTKAVVYRYIDISDGIIKYVGIVHKGSFGNRVQNHRYNDEWCSSRRWKIQYFECENKSEAEAFESHLISLYQTGKYFNKVKANWGTNSYLPDVENKWVDFMDDELLVVSDLMKYYIRNKEIEKAKALFDLIEFEEE